MDSYQYTCPNCSATCAVEEIMCGTDVVCPNCKQEFFATPPGAPPPGLPEKIPFFHSGKVKALEERLHAMTAAGELSKADREILDQFATALHLKPGDVDELLKSGFMKEFAPIQSRIEKTWELTDEDLGQIEALKRKYEITDFKMEGTAGFFRKIYLLDKCPNRSTPD